MKYILIIMLSIIFIGCKNNFLITNKIYCYSPIYGVYKSIYINSDGHFLYYNKVGLNSDSTSGKWKQIDNKRLILHPNIDKNCIQVVTASKNKIKNLNYINIKNLLGVNLIGVNIVINDTLGVISDEQGNILIEEKIPIKTLKIYYLNIPIPKYHTSLDQKYSFEIKINDEWNTYLGINDSIIKLRRKKIILDENVLKICN